MDTRVHLLTSVATLRYSRAAFFILNHNPEGTQAGLNLGLGASSTEITREPLRLTALYSSLVSRLCFFNVPTCSSRQSPAVSRRAWRCFIRACVNSAKVIALRPNKDLFARRVGQGCDLSVRPTVIAADFLTRVTSPRSSSVGTVATWNYFSVPRDLP